MYTWNLKNETKKVYYIEMNIRFYNEVGDVEYDEYGYLIRARDKDEAIKVAEALAETDGFEILEITELEECEGVDKLVVDIIDSEIVYNKIFCIEYNNGDEVYIKSNSEEEAEFEFKAILKRLNIDVEILNVYQVDNYDKNKLINDKTDSELKTMFESKTESEFNSVWNI